ncbi:TPM domain-containing protein, partial [Acinetobacter baumannii]
DGYEIAEYANKLFREWGIGNKKTNNGVLILAAIDDRKVWIEVGYGLEGAIPDVTASAIYRNEITPEFKQQNYYRGIDKAIDALSKA